MVTILFVLGFGAAVGVAVWTSRRTKGTGPSGSNHYLGGGASGTGTGIYGDGGSWSGGDGGGGGGGGGDGGGGGGGGGS